MEDLDDDPHVKYGTAIKIPEDKQDNLKYVPVHEQIVTDEEGRRRFHGAFTGGFSAGYYNTVGTKEGWTPSTFKSSRSKKSDRKNFAPQDFMDEEDRTNLGISAVNVSEEFMTTKKKSDIEEKQFKLQEDKMTLALGAELLETLVIPKRQNIGYKLLLKMGYKGDRGFKKKKKKDKDGASKKVYGCSLPGAASDSSDEDAFGIESVRFDDIDIIPDHLIQKGNYHGIGYQPLNPTEALHTKVKESSSVKAKTKSGNRLSFMGQAFGVGAFEEEDEDIYTTDSMRNYDAIMSEEKNPDSTYGWTRPMALTAGQERLAIENKPKGIKGFVPANEKSVFRIEEYPLPVVPPDFDVDRRMKMRREAERIKNMNLPQSSHIQLHPSTLSDAPSKYSDLTFEERRSKLADGSVAPATDASEPIKSVFDLISHEDRMRMEAAKRKKPLELGFQDDVEKASKIEDLKPIDRTTPLCDPKALKPFSNNPEKQRRFEEYERAIRQRKKHPYTEIVSSLTEWERNHEREEFHRVYQVHNRLVAHTISSRFTKGASEDILEETKTGLSMPKENAFGTLTRDKVDWHPDPLLCKRFNVPNPYPDSDFVGTPKDPSSMYIPLALMDVVKAPEEPPISIEAKERAKRATGIVSDTMKPPRFEGVKSSGKGRWDEKPVMSGPSTKEETVTQSSAQEEQKLTEGTEEGNSEENEEKDEAPSMDLFKSIFANDDDESSDESNESSEDEKKEENKGDKQPERAAADDVFKRPIIFQKPKRKQEQAKSEQEKSTPEDLEPKVEDNMDVDTSTTAEGSKDNDIEDFFGPALPPKRSSLFEVPTNGVHEHKSHKDHKKHSKHKKHKKEEKHKKKKKK
uniref:G patch domain-containing protein 1-like n=1 Tax=Phallusia mammillata TaxID=59560 RepID=A0A6F9DES1_9ASCI|nr:G patch domain-containing protein 1-like [Phallusia mammillata]